MEANKIPCRQAFTETLLELAKKDKDIIAVTSDARGSVTLTEFGEQLPSQFVEVGIAEQNAIGVGAGLALSGKKPFVCGPACFYSARSYEQVKVDVAYNKTNVKVIGVSGGVSYGALGSTHHSLNDIAVMRVLPDLTVILPCDVALTKKMTEILSDHEGPVYIRVGRGTVPDVYTEGEPEFTIGKANVLLEGSDLTLIGTGETVFHCLQAGKELANKGIKSRVLDMHTIKPLDLDAIEKAAKETGRIMVVEEHHVFGGLGSAIAEWVIQNHPVPMKIHGIPDKNAEHGSSKELFEFYGLNTSGIVKIVEDWIKNNK
ncbi:MAG: transketolase family protein [Bacteroidales bacterium]|nr:transketolase family protein [Bacteroidales bacterium]